MERYDLVTFGETMIRLSPPNFRRLEQTNLLEVNVGGSELNVAVGQDDREQGEGARGGHLPHRLDRRGSGGGVLRGVRRLPQAQRGALRP